MSWAEGLDIDLGAGSSAGALAYTRGAIISAGAQAGASTYAVAKVLRQQGIGFRYENIRDILAESKANLATSATAAALDIDASTGEILPGQAPANWDGTYFHQVTATYRTRDELGNYQLNYRTLGIRSVEALSPSEAISDALGIIEQPADEEEPNTPVMAGDLLSLQLTGAWYGTRPGIPGI